MNEENNQMTVLEPQPQRALSTHSQPLFSPSGFELAQRMATALSKSTLIPQNFQNNLPNCLIALEMANRMGASPMMVMQNLYIVHGRPAWSSQFVIAAINATRRFSPLRFEMKGEGAERECFAWAVEIATKERLEGPPVSIAMAKAEGWSTKNGSKWQTMPELMLRYRAATFFGRLYAPEILMGMKEETEVIDVEATVEPAIPRAQIGVVTPASEAADTSGAGEEKPAGNVTVIDPPASGKGTPRAGGKKLQGLKKTPPAAPAEPEPPATSEAPARPALAKVIESLAAANYTPVQLFAIVEHHGWADGAKEVAEMPDEKLEFFLDDWGSVLELLEEKFGKPTEKGAVR